MSATKMSRNRQRKTAYAAQADKSSRNEQAIAEPIVGHFETVTEKKPCFECRGAGRVYDPDSRSCDKCGGTGSVDVAGGRQVQVIVHDTSRSRSDGDLAHGGSSRPTRNPAARLRRQEGAWNRCSYKSKNGKHNFAPGSPNNCKCCGCPKSAGSMGEQY